MDIKYILRKSKKAYYSGWSDEELLICIEKAKKLSRKEIFQVYNSKWVDKNGGFSRKLFFLLHKDEIEKKEFQDLLVVCIQVGICFRRI